MHVVTCKPNDSKGKSTFALFVGQHKVSDHSTYLYVFQAIQQVPGELAGVLGEGRGGKVDGLGKGP